jgi:tellurite resistance protein
MAAKSMAYEYCGGSGQIICKECYGDPQRYGKVDCDPCKATGEIGKIVYIEIEVGSTSGEFYKYTNEIIQQIQKNPDILFKYLNKSEVKPQTVYTDINGDITEKYDSNSDEFCKSLEDFASLKKEDEYPRIISEEVFYDVIPLSTLEYNHILSGTMHKVSAVSNANSFNILFHSDPTSAKKFDIGNVFKAAGWSFKKAFATKSYKIKLDKKHELYLLVRVAKADGEIEDSEKRVLVDLISHLNEFSNKEKAELFNLFSMKELPPLAEEETVFSNKERAETAIQNLNKMMKEDGEIEAPEVKLIASLKEKINSNIGNHPGFLTSFFKTWQVSIPLMISLFSIIGVTVYLSFFAPKDDTNEDFSSAPITTNSDSVNSLVIETTAANNSPIIEEKTDTTNTIIEDSLSATSNSSDVIGEWKGAFGNDQLLINIESINEDGSVTGFNIVKNNKRALTGFKNGDVFELNEPGDDKWDGVFKFTITDNKATGTWAANNGKSTKQFSLTK